MDNGTIAAILARTHDFPILIQPTSRSLHEQTPTTSPNQETHYEALYSKSTESDCY